MTAAELRQAFPWLGSEDEEVSGADVVQALCDLYESLKTQADPSASGREEADTQSMNIKLNETIGSLQVTDRFLSLTRDGFELSEEIRAALIPIFGKWYELGVEPNVIEALVCHQTTLLGVTLVALHKEAVQKRAKGDDGNGDFSIE